MHFWDLAASVQLIFRIPNKRACGAPGCCGSVGTVEIKHPSCFQAFHLDLLLRFSHWFDLWSVRPCSSQNLQSGFKLSKETWRKFLQLNSWLPSAPGHWAVNYLPNLLCKISNSSRHCPSFRDKRWIFSLASGTVIQPGICSCNGCDLESFAVHIISDSS